jgi:hypothetical protein
MSFDLPRGTGDSALLAGRLSLGLAGQLMATQSVDISSNGKSAERCVTI